MRSRAIILSVIAGSALVALSLIGAAQANAHQRVAVASPPEEAELNSNGSAYEINIDPDGYLWISDFAADEIWQVDPATGAYTIYQGITAPSDARRDAAGFVWWGDGLDGRFGRLDPTTGTATWWTTSSVSGLFGTQIDANGDFWAVGWHEPYLYHFQPAAAQLCTYTLPLDTVAAYPLAHNGSIWLGDENNSQVLRLDPQAAQYTAWMLPLDSAPLGMTFDWMGNLWYTDPNNAYLARFRADANRLDTYDLPSGSLPEMITARGDNVWYSEQWDGAVGRLAPDQAISATITLTPATIAAPVACTTMTPSLTDTVTIVRGTLAWVTQTYSLLADSAGWQIHQLPGEGQDAPLPWGVAADAEQVWFVDTGRQVLGRIPQEPLVTVTACKLEDADGEAATTGDRTPLPGWTVYLTVDGARHGPGKPTSLDGCHTWQELPVGHVYSVEENVTEGWTALTPISHTFTVSAPGETYTHSFVNVEEGDDRVYLPLVLR